MSKDNEVILNMIIDILGEPNKSNEDKLQYAFNCPVCDEGKNKGNLEINLNKQVYHCWSCDSDDYSKGSLGNFFHHYGTPEQLKLYRVFRPTKKEKLEIEHKKVALPEGFISFDEINPHYPPHMQALNYLKSRGVSDSMIRKYKLGLTTVGKYANRIIFPSYDKNNELNFFVGRVWGKGHPKYLGFDGPKDDIIFNENLVDWDKDIYIVEGPFDALFSDNPVVILGSYLSRYKLEMIYNNAKSNVIIALDPDAKNKALKLYHELNGGKLWNRIKLLSLPDGEDMASLRGEVMSYVTSVK